MWISRQAARIRASEGPRGSAGFGASEHEGLGFLALLGPEALGSAFKMLLLLQCRRTRTGLSLVLPEHACLGSLAGGGVLYVAGSTNYHWMSHDIAHNYTHGK